MYFSLNFRWPLLGCSGGVGGPTPPVSAPHSAFKALPPPAVATGSCPNTLPPISSLRDAPAVRPATSTAQPPQEKMIPHPAPPPPPHPAFPVPMAPGINDSLQHLMSGNKALALSHYLSADPLAKAALMDLGRYGHYPLGKKLFGCPQCRYVTDRKNNLKRHIATMHQECDKVLECCGVAFKNKASLRDHVLIFHSNGYMCRFCGRNFCRKALLKRHLTVHSGQKDYVCSLCDYATSHKSNLERHKKVHERAGSDTEDGDQGPDEYGATSSHGCGSAYTGRDLASRDLSPRELAARAYQPPLYHQRPDQLRQANSSFMHGLNRNHSNPYMTSSSTITSTAVAGSNSQSQHTTPQQQQMLGLPKTDAFDLQMPSMVGQSLGMGSYAIDRILGGCKVPPHGGVTIEELDLEADESTDEDPRDLLGRREGDDEDTHSSGLIDVVHVDIQD